MHHYLTEEMQRKVDYQYTIGPYNIPAITITPGDTLTVETIDAYAGTITGENDLPSVVANPMPFRNPNNGPIFVTDATPGDALKITIRSIVPRGKWGTSVIQKDMGILTTMSSHLLKTVDEITRRFEVSEDGVAFNSHMTLPYEPFIGTIGTSHLIYSIDTLTPGNHGGNMDLPDIAPGATLYLPVRTKGAYLFLGDCHARQGDGEICGSAVEIPATVTMDIDLVKDWSIEWPLLENDDFIMAVGNAKPLEDAVRLACGNLLKWMCEKYGFNRWDAYFLLSQAAKIRVGNVVDPIFTVGASINKQYLLPSKERKYAD